MVTMVTTPTTGYYGYYGNEHFFKRSFVCLSWFSSSSIGPYSFHCHSEGPYSWVFASLCDEVPRLYSIRLNLQFWWGFRHSGRSPWPFPSLDKTILVVRTNRYLSWIQATYVWLRFEMTVSFKVIKIKSKLTGLLLMSGRWSGSWNRPLKPPVERLQQKNAK